MISLTVIGITATGMPPSVRSVAISVIVTVSCSVLVVRATLIASVRSRSVVSPVSALQTHLFQPSTGTDWPTGRPVSGIHDDTRVLRRRLPARAVRTDAPIAGMTISEAAERDVLNGDPLIIAIEHDGDILTPHGDPRIHSADIVAVFSRGGVDDQTVNAFIDSSS